MNGLVGWAGLRLHAWRVKVGGIKPCGVVAIRSGKNIGIDFQRTHDYGRSM